MVSKLQLKVTVAARFSFKKVAKILESILLSYRRNYTDYERRCPYTLRVHGLCNVRRHASQRHHPSADVHRTLLRGSRCSLKVFDYYGNLSEKSGNAWELCIKKKLPSAAEFGYREMICSVLVYSNGVGLVCG